MPYLIGLRRVGQRQRFFAVTPIQAMVTWPTITATINTALRLSANTIRPRTSVGGSRPVIPDLDISLTTPAHIDRRSQDGVEHAAP